MDKKYMHVGRLAQSGKWEIGSECFFAFSISFIIPFLRLDIKTNPNTGIKIINYLF